MSLLGVGAIGRLAVGQELDARILTAACGSFALAGEASTFRQQLAAATGSFAVAGGAATYQDQWVATAGVFVEAGEPAIFEGLLVESFGSFVLSGSPTIDLGAETANCGLFAFTGAPSLDSYDLLGGGGTIVAGTFSRGRWRALQEQIAAEQEAGRKAIAARKRRRLTRARSYYARQR